MEVQCIALIKSVHGKAHQHLIVIYSSIVGRVNTACVSLELNVLAVKIRAVMNQLVHLFPHVARSQTEEERLLRALARESTTAPKPLRRLLTTPSVATAAWLRAVEPDEKLLMRTVRAVL